MKKNGNIGKTEKEELKEMLLNGSGDLTGDKTPSYLTERQMDELQNEIRDEWGNGKEEGSIFHELKSEYVHTDVLALGKKGEPKTFASFGMSVRKMAVPEEVPDSFGRRIELVMRSSSGLEFEPEKKSGYPAIVAANEVVRVSKYPFREDTWLGFGHTLDATENFVEKFGYEFFLFLPVKESEIKGLGTVQFLQMIPVYEKERNWMASHDGGSIRFLQAYLEEFDGRDDEIFCIDLPRDVIIPEDGEEDEEEEDFVIE